MVCVMTCLEDKFFEIWKRFLEFEITRSKHCLQFAGTANAYLVLQVICWHQLLNVGEELADTSFDSTIEQWYLHSEATQTHDKKLTYALISELTGLDKETVRRNVKALETSGWVTTSRTGGICFSASEEMNAQLIELNMVERELVGKFAKILANNDAIDSAPAPVEPHLPVISPADKTASGKS